jgi:Fe2+ transport system protein FeoA
MRTFFQLLVRKGTALFCESWKLKLQRQKSCPKSQALSSFEGSGKACTKAFCPSGLFALAGLPCGVCVVIKSFDLAHDKAESLRRMGLREGSRISLLSQRDPMVIVLDHTRIAVSHRLARHIQVEAIS